MKIDSNECGSNRFNFFSALERKAISDLNCRPDFGNVTKTIESMSGAIRVGYLRDADVDAVIVQSVKSFARR